MTYKMKRDDAGNFDWPAIAQDRGMVTTAIVYLGIDRDEAPWEIVAAGDTLDDATGGTVTPDFAATQILLAAAQHSIDQTTKGEWLADERAKEIDGLKRELEASRRELTNQRDTARFAAAIHRGEAERLAGGSIQDGARDSASKKDAELVLIAITAERDDIAAKLVSEGERRAEAVQLACDRGLEIDQLREELGRVNAAWLKSQTIRNGEMLAANSERNDAKGQAHLSNRLAAQRLGTIKALNRRVAELDGMISSLLAEQRGSQQIGEDAARGDEQSRLIEGQSKDIALLTRELDDLTAKLAASNEERELDRAKIKGLIGELNDRDIGIKIAVNLASRRAERISELEAMDDADTKSIESLGQKLKEAEDALWCKTQEIEFSFKQRDELGRIATGRAKEIDSLRKSLDIARVDMASHCGRADRLAAELEETKAAHVAAMATASEIAAKARREAEIRNGIGTRRTFSSTIPIGVTFAGMPGVEHVATSTYRECADAYDRVMNEATAMRAEIDSLKLRIENNARALHKMTQQRDRLEAWRVANESEIDGPASETRRKIIDERNSFKVSYLWTKGKLETTLSVLETERNNSAAGKAFMEMVESRGRGIDWDKLASSPYSVQAARDFLDAEDYHDVCDAACDMSEINRVPMWIVATGITMAAEKIANEGGTDSE